MKNYTTTQKILIFLFTILYCCVGFVSLYHAIDFFSLSNESWLATILACAFEIGQAGVLFSLLTQNEKKIMPWILMVILTAVQCMGNIFASFKYMILNNSDQLHFFTDSILFFVKNPNPAYNQVMISYITGAILPIVALCMTGMVVSLINSKKDDKIAENNVPEKETLSVEEPTVDEKTDKKSQDSNPATKTQPIQKVDFRPQDVVETKKTDKEKLKDRNIMASDRKPIHIDNMEDSNKFIV